MRVQSIIFSPTGGTERIADILSEGLGEDIRRIDLTDSHMDFSTVPIYADDIAIIALPSYGGRVPEIAADRLSRIEGNKAATILVCAYGNRAYEDTLIELYDIAKEAGFRPVAAIAAIAEHSIARQFAHGRPDDDDRDTLSSFAEAIRDKLAAGDYPEPAIPGNRPYKERKVIGPVPEADGKCTDCGLCSRLCPVQAIGTDNPCIFCMRCIKVCPHSARSIDSGMLSRISDMLEKACCGRKEPELFV